MIFVGRQYIVPNLVLQHLIEAIEENHENHGLACVLGRIRTPGSSRFGDEEGQLII
jgi:hypothetical protein